MTNSLKKKADEERKKMVAQHVSKTKSWIDSMIYTPSESTDNQKNKLLEGGTKVDSGTKVHNTKVDSGTKVPLGGGTKVDSGTKVHNTFVPRGTKVPPTESNHSGTFVPPPIFHKSLFDLIQATGGFTLFGFGVVLDWALQENNGWVRLKSIATMLNLEYSGIRKQLRKLENLGLISIIESNANGSRITLTNSLKLCVERYKNISQIMVTNSSGGGGTFVLPPPRFVSLFYKDLKTYKPWDRAKFLTQLKEIFGLCLALGWSPMEQPKEILDLYGTIRQTHEADWAIAFFLQYVPESRKNVVKYLQAVYAKDGAPDPKVASPDADRRWYQAEQILAAMVALPQKIGEDILPDEWLKAVRPLKVQADKKNIMQKQEALLIRLREFLSEDIEISDTNDAKGE